MTAFTLRLALGAFCTLGLAACTEEPAYEADAEAQSGELIVTDENTNAVPVNTPDTPMTPVPEEGAIEAGEPMASETEAPTM